MQRTEKYFEQDAFRTECESVILPQSRTKKDRRRAHCAGRHGVLPEGGGQPADRGTLTLAGRHQCCM